MERTSRDAWAKRVERWRDSGLTAKEFATELGVKPGTLTWWKWRLGSKLAKSASPLAKSRPPIAKGAESISPLTFIEMTTAARSEPMEVVLRSEIRVRVPSTFDVAALRRLLDVLERR